MDANDGRGVGGDWTDPTNQTTGQNTEFWNGASRTYCVPEGPIEFEAREPANNYMTPKNTERTYGKGVFYPCVDGFQSWNESELANTPLLWRLALYLEW